MESKVVKNVKNTVIGFFVVVFIMGFFSRSIINLFLPKVITEPALEGAVERTLNVDGVIEAKNSFQVRLAGEVVVEEYFVKSGESVEVGKPLFRINKAYGLQGNAAEIERLKLEEDALRIRISNLKIGSDQVELMDILAMEEKLEKSKAELAGQQALFDAGAISRQELDNYIADIERQKLDIDKAKLQLDERKRQNLASIKELEGQIKGIELQIKGLGSKDGFYSNVDEEGICYSTADGIVTAVGQAQSILPQDTVLVGIAETGENTGLKYVVEIMEEDYDLVKEAGEIQINAEDILKSEFLKITSIYRDVNNSYKVEAALPSSGEKKYTIGQKLKGIVEQKYVAQGSYKISKSAVIVYGEYKVGSEGTVYLLDVQEGVLGKEIRAKEVPVKLLAIGDDAVLVSGLEGFEKPEVILNLSYKINNGTKVFLWQ